MDSFLKRHGENVWSRVVPNDLRSGCVVDVSQVSAAPLHIEAFVVKVELQRQVFGRLLGKPTEVEPRKELVRSVHEKPHRENVGHGGLLEPLVLDFDGQFLSRLLQHGGVNLRQGCRGHRLGREVVEQLIQRSTELSGDDPLNHAHWLVRARCQQRGQGAAVLLWNHVLQLCQVLPKLDVQAAISSAQFQQRQCSALVGPPRQLLGISAPEPVQLVVQCNLRCHAHAPHQPREPRRSAAAVVVQVIRHNPTDRRQASTCRQSQ
mmetsp:Transcript_5497/g.16389  ORF Transcript_5497/g.16389 Transcript_5497/m.16389 type:complete len:263 (+) Transcript_5497:862-1650(+)